MKTHSIVKAIEIGLNAAQQKAVFHQNGPLLVLAGPGSGKTRVITYRIANLLAQDVEPYRILGLTFTNKAAREMINRVEKLMPERKGIWLSTFHSFCARMLRREGYLLGYTSDYSIYDVDDQKRALKYVLEKIKSAYKINIEEARHFIGNCKNKSIEPTLDESTNPRKKSLIKIYHGYQELLQQNNAMDFDDLLLKTLELLNHYKDVRSYYQDKFRHILIDEFQDTNLTQYKIARLLIGSHYNICATGDPDQSIYSWRGADIRNILSFEEDFPNAVAIRLEQNYRSTKKILKAASALIANNRMRKDKTLWTENVSGESIKIRKAYDDYDEAKQVCQDIVNLRENGHSLNDIVVFYRVNAQSRAMETALRRRGVPYAIVGGLEFYKRAEIKNAMAYLRLLVNPNDSLSLLRIVNIPPRGIGKVTCNKLIELAEDNRISLRSALRHDEIINCFSPRPKKALKKFSQMLDELGCQKFSSLVTLIESVLEKSGYLEYIQTQDKEKDEDREENLKEFVASAYEYQKEFQDSSLTDFLERTSLIADVDHWDQNLEQEKVTLMTLHSAKGLEFPIVYIIGMMEGLLPHSRSESNAELEEERRLAFVGITRAKFKLTLSFPMISYRRSYSGHNEPSRFLQEIPEDVCRFIDKSKY